MQSQGLALRCKNFSRRACHLHTGNVLASSNFKTKESIKDKDKTRDKEKHNVKYKDKAPSPLLVHR